MPQVPNENPIDYLTRRRYPAAFAEYRHSFGNAFSEDVQPGFRDDLLDEQTTEIDKFREDLKSKSPEEIANLVEAEKRAELTEIASRALHAEQRHFFHSLRARADFEHYCKCACWTLDEAIALSLGKAPEIVNWQTVSPLAQVSDFAREYAKRRDLVERAVWAKQLFDPIHPSIFLSWAIRLQLSVPDELESAAAQVGLSLQGWQDLYEEALEQNRQSIQFLTKEHAEKVLSLEEQLRACRELIAEFAQGQNEASASERKLGTRERENLQLMTVVSAIKAYGFDPVNRNSAARLIEQDLERIGTRISGDTIRKQLTAGAELLPGGWHEKLSFNRNSSSAKPNSA